MKGNYLITIAKGEEGFVVSIYGDGNPNGVFDTFKTAKEVTEAVATLTAEVEE